MRGAFPCNVHVPQIQDVDVSLHSGYDFCIKRGEEIIFKTLHCVEKVSAQFVISRVDP